MNFDNTYVSIDLDVISANFDRIATKAGTKVMAVIKADAYGHGAVQVARLLKDKCSFFGVSSMLEALELRQAGLDTPILILGQTPMAAFPDAIRLGIRPAIFHYEAAQALSAEAVRQGVVAPFHFAVDTGMSRLGMQATEESADLCAKIAKLPGLYPEGLFSHFATADCADLTRARAQAAKFDAFVAMLEERGVQIPIRHMDNSAGVSGAAMAQPCDPGKDPGSRTGDQLRRHLCYRSSHSGGNRAGGLCRWLSQKPQRQVLCADPWYAGADFGQSLYGPNGGGCYPHPRREAER